MANTKREKLFAEFPPVPTEKWEEVIAVDLKGADYERKLVWRTNEGFNVRPYYRADSLEGLRFLASQPGEFPYVRGTRCDNLWRVHQTLTVETPEAANAEVLELLNSGIDSLGFRLTRAFTETEIDTLLREIHLPAIEVVFSGEGTTSAVEPVLAKIEREGWQETAGVHFAFDPIVEHLSLGGEFRSPGGKECFRRLAELIRRTAGMKGVRTVTVSGENFSNAGSTIVEELAFTLSAGHDYLVRLMDEGLTVDEAARKIRFSLGVTSNYFMEMAKFRAARMLWANIVEGYSPEKPCSRKMFAHAVTSTWNQTVYDPYINMLRGTTEAMSAAIAGVHSLEVTPFNASFAAPDAFSKRIARNAELLLKHESHFDQVVDPAGGSYYIENLTQSIAGEAWKLFLDLEERGGYIEAFKAGYIVERVEASAAAKDKSVSQRRITLLGANQYPNFTEVASAEVGEAAVARASKPGVLNPYRGAMAFEAMRLHVDRSGKTPKAFMLTAGHLAMARARAQFSCNFFACAGIRVQDNTFFKDLEEGVKAALESKAEIVVLCSSDDCYAELAPKVKELLGGRAILVVAGAPACMPELEAQGIRNFIHVKSNVLDTLRNYLVQMGI